MGTGGCPSAEFGDRRHRVRSLAQDPRGVEDLLRASVQSGVAHCIHHLLCQVLSGAEIGAAWDLDEWDHRLAHRSMSLLVLMLEHRAQAPPRLIQQGSRRPGLRGPRQGTDPFEGDHHHLLLELVLVDRPLQVLVALAHARRLRSNSPGSSTCNTVC
jgi:hypothetical protein